MLALIDADCLPLYAEEENEETEEKEAVDIIERFLRSTEKEEMLKMLFLESICSICRISKKNGLCESLAIFCRERNLAEEVKELLENEPMDQLRTAVRYQAMLAIAALSEMKAISEEEIIRLSHACFKAIFCLPPKEDLNICLYNQTMRAMEKMLQSLLVSHHTSNRDKLQNILEVLLLYTSSQTKTVRERAMEQISKLYCFCQEPFGKLLQPSQRTDIVLMALEKTTEDCAVEDSEWSEILLDMVLSQPSDWLMDAPVIVRFIHRHLKSNSTSIQETLFSVLEVLAYEFPRDVLMSVLIHLPQNDSTMDMWKNIIYCTQSSESILEELCTVLVEEEICGIPIEELDLLRLTVPQILESIHRNLRRRLASLQQTLFSLLDMLTSLFPRDVLMSVLIHLPQSDSTTLDMWKRMLAPTATSEKLLEALCSVLQDQLLCMIFNITAVDFSLLRLTVMCPTEEIRQELCNPDLFQMFLKIKSLPLLWLVLRGLVLLSERPETAREIRALLPDVMETLQFGNAHITLNALTIFRNVMNHLGKMEARPIALELAGKLLYLFNHVSGEVRESSILLFKDVIEAVVWWQKGKMKKKVRRGLLPLLFRNSDETSSVAQAAREALVACARFLKWQKLEHQAERRNVVGITECLLEQKRQMVAKNLRQSLLYLKDPQATIRQEALLFIGLAWSYWNPSEGKRKKIYSVLHSLEHDSRPLVRCQATQSENPDSEMFTAAEKIRMGQACRTVLLALQFPLSS
uniref:Maestro heat like repeat family member 7 n=1 Tax=Meleagris gallopavo TaxID=9103 RepID=A0A803Y724_MELGA